MKKVLLLTVLFSFSVATPMRASNDASSYLRQGLYLAAASAAFYAAYQYLTQEVESVLDESPNQVNDGQDGQVDDNQKVDSAEVEKVSKEFRLLRKSINKFYSSEVQVKEKLFSDQALEDWKKFIDEVRGYTTEFNEEKEKGLTQEQCNEWSEIIILLVREFIIQKNTLKALSPSPPNTTKEQISKAIVSNQSVAKALQSLNQDQLEAGLKKSVQPEQGNQVTSAKKQETQTSKQTKKKPVPPPPPTKIVGGQSVTTALQGFDPSKLKAGLKKLDKSQKGNPSAKKNQEEIDNMTPRQRIEYMKSLENNN